MLCSQDVLRLTWVTATQKGRAPATCVEGRCDHGQDQKQDHPSRKHQAGENGLINRTQRRKPRLDTVACSVHRCIPLAWDTGAPG